MSTHRESFDDELELELEDPIERIVPSVMPFRSVQERPQADVVVFTPPKWPLLVGVFNFPWYRHSVVPWMMMSLALTGAGLVLVLCYYFLTLGGFGMVVGRVIALPAGTLAAFALSYASTLYLIVIEQTSLGYDAIEEWELPDWREGFWTLPQTVGWLGAAWMIGFFTVGLIPGVSWLAIALVALVLYPVFLLSSLEEGKMGVPMTAPIARSFRSQGLTWILFYSLTISILLPLVWLFVDRFPGRPFANTALFGPVIASLVFIYGRLVGRLAWCLVDREKR